MIAHVALQTAHLLLDKGDIETDQSRQEELASNLRREELDIESFSLAFFISYQDRSLLGLYV